MGKTRCTLLCFIVYAHKQLTLISLLPTAGRLTKRETCFHHKTLIYFFCQNINIYDLSPTSPSLAKSLCENSNVANKY